MRTRTVNGYEITGTRRCALAIAKTNINNFCYFTEQWMEYEFSDAFVAALCWADPSLKDAKYTCCGEPFHTLLDIVNDSRCKYTLQHLQDRFPTLPLTEAASGKVI